MTDISKLPEEVPLWKVREIFGISPQTFVKRYKGRFEFAKAHEHITKQSLAKIIEEDQQAQITEPIMHYLEAATMLELTRDSLNRIIRLQNWQRPKTGYVYKRDVIAELNRRPKRERHHNYVPHFTIADGHLIIPYQDDKHLQSILTLLSGGWDA